MTRNKISHILISLVLACTLFSCQSHDDEEPRPAESGDAIAFTAIAPENVAARASGVQTTASLSEFTVYSFIASDSSPYMTDVTVKRNSDGLWQYAPTAYWPIGQKLNFFSFSPGSDEIHAERVDAPNASGEPDMRNFRNDGLVDLLYGVNMGLDINCRQVKVNFRHALSRVRFAFRRKAEADYRIELSDVELQHVASSGSFRFPRTTTAAGDITQSVGTWSELADISSPTINTTALAVAADKPVTANSTDYQFFIPQELGDTVGQAATTLKVRCKIIGAKGNVLWPQDKEADGYDPASGTACVTLPLRKENATEWKLGHAYNYIITLTPPAEPQSPFIDFDVTVDVYQDFTEKPDETVHYIQFDPIMPEGSNLAKITDFRVWAANLKRDLMNDVTVTRNGADWIYEPLTQWPLTVSDFYGLSVGGWIADSLRYSYFTPVFSAEGPQTMKVENFNVGGKANQGYKLGTNGGADLLYAKLTDQLYRGNKGVPLPFRHALAKIQILYRVRGRDNIIMVERGTYFKCNHTVGTFTYPFVATQNGNQATLADWKTGTPGIIQLFSGNAKLEVTTADFHACRNGGQEEYVLPQKVTVWDKLDKADRFETGQYLFIRARFIDAKTRATIWPTGPENYGYNDRNKDAYLFVALTDREFQWTPGHYYLYEVMFGKPTAPYTQEDHDARRPFTYEDYVMRVWEFSDFDGKNLVTTYEFGKY